MQLHRYRNHLLAAVVFLGCLLVAAHVWRLCERSDKIAFLPSASGAEWIIDPVPADVTAHLPLPVRVTFKRTFTLNALTSGATLTVRAFKTAAVSLNGHVITALPCDGRNWKLPATADVGGLLLAGTNELTVSVTNSYGPPALWLHLQAGEFSLGTDAAWFTSPIDSHWLSAQPAAQPPAVPAWSPLYDGASILDSLRASWRELAIFAVLSALLVLGVNEGFKRVSARPMGDRVTLLLFVVFAVRIALFNHDAPGIPRATGFDSVEHEQYIQFIQDKKALPLPNDGWEMHQPPLYYAVSAAWLGLGGFSAGTDRALLPLRMVNGIVGLLQCWLVLLCLRRLFPKNFSAQAAGLLVAAFLPANLYLSLYVANDPLASLCVTLAFYFFLRLNESETENPRLAIAIGLTLGAGMLAKLNCMLAVPVFLAAMGLRLWRRGNFSPREWLRGPVAALLACLLMCGWHYYRVWKQIGGLPLPNSQTDPASAWWQFPGYRTAGFYLHFGHALASPLFSGLSSFWDGIYSTLWSDGLISGYSRQTLRPPWNYDLLNAGGWLALALTALAVIGLAIYLYRTCRQWEPAALLMAGTIFAFVVGIILVTLQTPCLGDVKAFYALPALVPFCALIAAGWGWLAQKNRAVQLFLWMVIVFWAITAANAFWIQEDTVQSLRIRAMVNFSKGDVADGTASVTSALQLNPASPETHDLLASLLLRQGKTPEALQEYTRVLSLRPDSPEVFDQVARILLGESTNDVNQAVQFASRACDLTNYRQGGYVSTLAAAYAAAGQGDHASTTAQIACELAAQSGDKNLLQKNQALLDRYQPPPPARP